MTTVLHTRSDEIGDLAIEQYRRWREEVMARGTVEDRPSSPTENSTKPEHPGTA